MGHPRMKLERARARVSPSNSAGRRIYTGKITDDECFTPVSRGYAFFIHACNSVGIFIAPSRFHPLHACIWHEAFSGRRGRRDAGNVHVCTLCMYIRGRITVRAVLGLLRIMRHCRNARVRHSITAGDNAFRPYVNYGSARVNSRNI